MLSHRPGFLGTTLGVFGLCALLTYFLLGGSDVSDAGGMQMAGIAPMPSVESFLASDIERVSYSPAEGEGESDALPKLSIDEAKRSSELSVVTGRIPKRGTIATALAAQDVPASIVHEVAEAMKPVFSFKGAHAGDFFALIRNDAGEVLSFEFQRGRRNIYRVERTESGEYRASESEVPLERRVVQFGGVINQSVSEAFLGLGEQWALVQSFADIFVWDVDFSTQSRPGDEFRLVFEKFYDRDGFVRYGRILAAEYRAAQRNFVAVYFEDEQGAGAYYTPEGNSVRRSFLRAPVNYTRISSRYSKSRLHPVLNVRRPHEGIDYAAPTGTPVWAVADGEVIFMGWSGGFGRLVKVRHNNGYVTYYGHLSRYGAIKVGDRIGQKDVLGYVGKTGLATGPHLDYRLKIAGRFVDPLEVKFPNGASVPVKARERFEEIKELRLAELRDAQPPLVLEAAM